MSKLSFRARALDATKPLPIYHAVDLPDLSEYNTINRTVPQMPTGMEKEEETECHLQDVILAQQTNNSKKHVVIPTPENAINVPYYQKIAATMEKPPSRYIRLPGLSLDEDVPDYDLDSEDEEWLSLQTNEKPLSCIHFERMMDKLEKGSGNTVLSEREAQALLKDDEDLVLAVYDYWLAKRLRLGRALNPTVKQERRDGSSSGSNPYLAFRKRTEKMQTRKNRKNDETAYMQMQKLKRDLDKAHSLSGLVKEREAKKHALARVHMDIFKKRYLLEDWSGSIMASLCPVATRSATSRQNSNINESAWDGSSVLKVEGGDDYDVHQVGRHEVLVSSGLKKKRKRRYYFSNNVSESPLPPSVPTTPDKMTLDSSRELPSDKLQEDEELDGKFTFKRKPHVKYHSPYTCFGDWPWSNDLEPPPRYTRGSEAGGSDGEMEQGSFTTRARMPKPRKYRFSRLTLSGKFIGLCRRRIGRGSRTIIDRFSLSLNDDEDTDTDVKMEIDNSHVTTPLIANPTSSYSHTPMDSPIPSVTTTPSRIQKQHSEIMVTPVTGERLNDSLVQSQSAPLLSSHDGGGGSLTNENENVGSESLKQEGVGGTRGVAKKSSKRNLHFVDRTPSPTSNFEFPCLPFINQSHPSLLDFMDHAPSDPSTSGTENMSLRRLPSYSDYREETSTFSSLPTSHFTLRPSSFDTELDGPPTSFWNWNHPSTGLGNEQRHASAGSSNSNNINPPYPSAPNLFYGAHSSYSRQKLAQQVPGQDGPADTKVKDVSRSSLSVTDSKTIVLTNSPAPWQSGAGNKKKETDKDRLLAQHQNHKLSAGSGSQTKKLHLSSHLHGENSQVASAKKLKKLVQNEVNDEPKQNSVLPSKGSSSPPPSVENRASDRLLINNVETGGRSADESISGTATKVIKDSVDKGTLGTIKESSGVSGQIMKNKPTGGSVSNSSVAGSEVDPASVISDGLGSSSHSGSVKKSDPLMSESRNEVGGGMGANEQDIWSLKGPANGILSMNVHSNARKDRVHLKKSRKSDLIVGATLESALMITSQFVTKPLPMIKKKDETVPGSDVLPSIGGLLARGSSGSRSGSSTPTILSSMDTPQKWSGGIGGIGATMANLSASKLTELHPPVSNSSTQLQENMVSKGSDIKRTNSVSDGMIGHVTSQGISQQHTNASSPGTNGTNFQEIFSSTKRRLSENTERGLKQALAGTVMNHNSLLENAAKPLVSQTLKNSSEVT